MEKITNSSNAPFGRGLSHNNYSMNNWPYHADGNNDWELPCNMDYYCDDRSVTDTTN